MQISGIKNPFIGSENFKPPSNKFLSLFELFWWQFISKPLFAKYPLINCQASHLLVLVQHKTRIPKKFHERFYCLRNVSAAAGGIGKVSGRVSLPIWWPSHNLLVHSSLYLHKNTRSGPFKGRFDIFYDVSVVVAVKSIKLTVSTCAHDGEARRNIFFCLFSLESLFTWRIRSKTEWLCWCENFSPFIDSKVSFLRRNHFSLPLLAFDF